MRFALAADIAPTRGKLRARNVNIPSRMPHLHGLLVIDKPTGITSRAAVDRAERWFPPNTRIGHAGTLDPQATGVLVLCVGNATRLVEFVQQMTKVYRADVTLGATSDTDDADGVISPVQGPGVKGVPTRDEMDQVLGEFVGIISQVPPAYSAAKVAGRRAHDLARKGREFELKPRTVRIDRLDVLTYEYPHLELVVRCGKGTYIRSLARDLGQRLGCGGYIQSLRRLEIGWFKEADAISLEADADAARAHVLPSWRAIQDWPPTLAADADVAKLRQGQGIAHVHGNFGDCSYLAVVDNNQRMVAVVRPERGYLRPVKVFMDTM